MSPLIDPGLLPYAGGGRMAHRPCKLKGREVRPGLQCVEVTGTCADQVSVCCASQFELGMSALPRDVAAKVMMIISNDACGVSNKLTARETELEACKAQLRALRFRLGVAEEDSRALKNSRTSLQEQNDKLARQHKDCRCGQGRVGCRIAELRGWVHACCSACTFPWWRDAGVSARTRGRDRHTPSPPAGPRGLTAAPSCSSGSSRTRRTRVRRRGWQSTC